MVCSKFNSCFSSILITVVTFTTPARGYAMPAAKHPGCFKKIEFEKLSLRSYVLEQAKMNRN